MNWSNWSEFWAMGGDGLYVWGAYLVALVVAATEIGILAVSRRAILAHLGRFARRGRTLGARAEEPGAGARATRR